MWQRIAEQVRTVGVPHRILLRKSAMRADGSCFTDRDVHAVLRRKGFAIRDSAAASGLSVPWMM